MATSAFAVVRKLALSAPVTLPSVSIARSSHGGHELIAAGFGHCSGSSFRPPAWYSAWIRGLPHPWLSEDCRWVLALGESALRGCGVRDGELFPGDLGEIWEKLRAWGLGGETECLCEETRVFLK